MNKPSGITEFLMRHAKLRPVSFHMPGHKGSDIFRKYGFGDFISCMADCDITEITGADNLFQAEGIIAETAEKYRNLYDVRKSYILINGTSGGLIAAILASVPAGKKLIMARNCHKSVFNALTLGNVTPVYAYPPVMDDYGISGAVRPDEIKRLLRENPDTAAVILPSPNYYGICSDIKAISEVVHEAGKILIVDQAHGAHLKFFTAFGSGRLDMPPAAEDCGADIVVNSTHKTLLSFTQSAVLNVVTNRVNLPCLEDKLQMIESTSPSYLLMASLDMNAEMFLEHGKEIISGWENMLEGFYEKASGIKPLSIMTAPGYMDRTKINLDMSAAGINGARLEELLMRENIFCELTTGNLLMCMTGAGNTAADSDRLLEALESISREYSGNSIAGKAPHAGTECTAVWALRRELHKVPAEKEYVRLEDSACRVCASSIIPYPPGIPLVCPGEVITGEDVDYVKALRERGEKVIGIDAGGYVAVGKSC